MALGSLEPTSDLSEVTHRKRGGFYAQGILDMFDFSYPSSFDSVDVSSSVEEALINEPHKSCHLLGFDVFLTLSYALLPSISTSISSPELQF